MSFFIINISAASLALSFILTHKFLSILMPVFACTSWIYNRQKLSLSLSIPFIILALLTGWASLSCFWCLNTSYGLKTFIKILTWLVFSFILIENIKLLTLKEREKLIEFSKKIFIYFMTLLIIIYSIQNVLFYYYNAFRISNKSLDLLTAQLFKPAGTFLSLTIFIIIGFYLKEKKKNWVIGLILFSLPLVYLTESFAARVALLIGLITFPISYMFPLISIRILLVSTYTYLVMSPMLLIGFVAKFTPHLPFSSLLARFSIWIFSYQHWLQKPFLGWGLGSSSYLPNSSTEYVIGLPRMSMHPHNNPLQMFLELGVVGGILYALFFASLCWHLLNFTKDRIFTATANATLVSTIVICSISYSAWNAWWLSWMTLTAGLLFLLKDYKPSSSSPKDLTQQT